MTSLVQRQAIRVIPQVRPAVRSLCRRSYPNHPRGCPNWNKRSTCPPNAPLLREILNLSLPVYCVYNAFDLAGHIAKMRRGHPDWTERQLRCVLYWQGRARKQLRGKVRGFLEDHPDCIAVYCPEGAGIDVTATMASVGINLEWPPVSAAYQVALVGTPRK